MRATGLIDTGALLALLDENDAWHKRCVAAFQSLRYPLATSRWQTKIPYRTLALSLSNKMTATPAVFISLI